MAKKKAPPTEQSTPAAEYTAVARRYRPRQFAELIGQDHVAAALVQALQSDRVAHAYLFTGARGVGKTSAARILAKALNCVKGPTATPCDECESCRAIAIGEDVDVQEIDGASNNKVDEAREIRQSVGFRPTRSRFKIYIIDEVHMLSTGAFNALLKTLEEPPTHVKFILATTEVQKIPITILSRCQRFDFAFVGASKIFDQLKRIVEQEGFQADDDALKLIARRAGGSIRDSQSLLDQLLASSAGKLSLEQVHATLGSTGDERVTELASALVKRDPKAALDLFADWLDRGLQVGELIDQLVAYWRILMLVKCGGNVIRELPASPGQLEAASSQAKQINLDEILAGLDILATTKWRIRDSAHAMVLLEMAIVRLARLNELLPVGQLVGMLSATGQQPVGGARQQLVHSEAAEPSKKNGLVRGDQRDDVPGSPAQNRLLVLNRSTVEEIWNQLMSYLGGKTPILAAHLKYANLPAISAPNSLVISFDSAYNQAYETCDKEENIRRIEDGLLRVTGLPIQVHCDLLTTGASGTPNEPTAAPASIGDRKKDLMGLPLFQKAGEALGAQIWHVDQEFNPAAPAKPVAKPEVETDTEEN